MFTDIKKFWENVSPTWRHFSNGKQVINNHKKEFIIKNVNDYLLSKIDFTHIKTSLDWGCGGGILAKELGKHSKVCIVDITQTSLENAEKYLTSEGYIFSQEISNDINDYVYEGPEIDLIFSHAVIHHFPTIKYFKEVLEVWKKIAPRYIAIQVKLADKTQEAENYENDFLNGLFINEKDLTSYFGDINYAVVSKEFGKTLNKKIKLGYYVFQQQK